MSPRFISNLLLAAGGVVIVVFSQAIGSVTTGWITFGIAIGVLTMLGVVQLDRGRGLSQRALDCLTGPLAAWTIIASVVFTKGTLTWLSFAEGIGLATLALAGLVVNELSTERIVHSLAIEDGRPAVATHTAPDYSAS